MLERREMERDRHKIILLVEDEQITAIFEIKMLERHGYRVISAPSGEKAVELVRVTPDIDLILMDIDLGQGIDGTQAAEKILKIKNIPILFLSSHTEQEIVDKTEKITSYGYVVKNSGETVLIASIKMAFKLYNANHTVELKSEELNASNEELQATMEELISTNQELERLLSENKLAYKTLSEKEYLLQKSQEIARVGSYVREYKGDNYQIESIQATPTFYEIFGFDESAELTSEYMMSIHPDSEKIIEDFKRLLHNRTEYYVREDMIKRSIDGALRWIYSIGEIFYDDCGNLVRIIGTSQDITERKLAEEGLA